MIFLCLNTGLWGTSLDKYVKILLEIRKSTNRGTIFPIGWVLNIQVWLYIFTEVSLQENLLEKGESLK